MFVNELLARLPVRLGHGVSFERDADHGLFAVELVVHGVHRGGRADHVDEAAARQHGDLDEPREIAAVEVLHGPVGALDP